MKTLLKNSDFTVKARVELVVDEIFIECEENRSWDLAITEKGTTCYWRRTLLKIGERNITTVDLWLSEDGFLRNHIGLICKLK